MGIFRESYKIISSWRKLFAQITLSLILPLSFIFLAHIQISNLIFTQIDHNEAALEYTKPGSAREDRLLNRLSSEWAAFLAFKLAYLLLVLVFSLLSTSAVVYAIACIYTAKEMTFKKILTVVPKVWKRLMVTFFWTFLILLGYNTATGLLMVFLLILFGSSPVGLTLMITLIIFYLIGMVYISLVWHLASVISVLEDVYGIAAMKKSKELIKGRTWVAAAIFLILNIAFIAIHLLFSFTVVHGRPVGAGSKIGYGLLSLILMAGFILIGLVIQTVIYFVCKSYHHESIDKSCLADHLEVYMGEYVPLNGKSVQMEHFSV